MIVYKHYKNGFRYRIVEEDITYSGEGAVTSSSMVFYQRLDENNRPLPDHKYVRPAQEFYEAVVWQGKTMRRFSPVECPECPEVEE